MKDDELKSLLRQLIGITFTEALHREMDYQRQRDHKDPVLEQVARELVQH